MKRMLKRTDLVFKWRFTEGCGARAVWIDGQPAAERQFARAAVFANAGNVRRLI